MLTDTEIKRAKPREKDYRMKDGRGLYLLVTPAGGKLLDVDEGPWTAGGAA